MEACPLDVQMEACPFSDFFIIAQLRYHVTCVYSANQQGQDRYNDTDSPNLANFASRVTCCCRFPWLLPMLKPEDVAERSMRAILTDRRTVYIPRLLYFLETISTYAINLYTCALAQMHAHASTRTHCTCAYITVRTHPRHS